jgi:hypothetical protein
VFFITCLAAIFHFNVYIFWLVLFAIVAVWVAKKSIKEKSFYFLLITVLYGYVALGFTVINLALKILNSFDIGIFYFILLYLLLGLFSYSFILTKNLNKMIIYNKEWLINKHIQTQALLAYKSGIVTKEEKGYILQTYRVVFYSPNYFIRIGLGILTFIIIFFTNGFFGLIVSAFSSNFNILLLVTGIFCYVNIEIMVSKQNHYSSGVDDVLLYTSILLVVNGLCFIASFQNNWLNSINALLYFMVKFMASLRFLDRVTTIGAYISLFAFCN